MNFISMADKKITLIGVAGASCSGKSWLCERIRFLFPGIACEIISLDSYYRDLSSMLESERARQNFDVPDALDKKLLEKHMHSLSDGVPIDVPIYDFATHTRLLEKRRINPFGKIILVEGLFSFYWENIRCLFTQKVFIDFSEEQRLSRRLARDTKDRGRETKAIEEQHKTTVIPMYNKFIKPTKKYADIIVDGNLEDTQIEKTFSSLLSQLS
jgi:uridine kinase